MAEPLILTFDIGTQSARALLVSPQGRILFKAQRAYETPYYSIQPGWAEQRAEFYWEKLCETSRNLKEQAGALWHDIIAVTCTTIRDTCLCVDKNCKPLRNVIVWIDDRRVENLSPLPAVTAMLFKAARLREMIELQRRVCHSNWIKVNERDIWDRTDKFVLISTWLNYKLCGNLLDSSAGIIGHIPFDTKLRKWMKPTDIRRCIFGVEDDKLFDFVEPGKTLGTIATTAARETGIPAGLPLIATGSDKGCETLGLSCISSEKAALSFGTTATIQFSTQTYLEPQPHMPAYPAIVPGYYNPEIEIYRGYWLLSWFKKEFASKEVAEAQKLGIDAEWLLDKRLQEINPGCDGLILQPYFTPGVSMPHAKGAAIGMTDVHTRIHFYRAIIEGINFALLDGLRLMEKRGKLRISSLFVAGGGSQSNEICRITASQFGLPVYRVQTHEATGLGSSIVAFIAKGIFSSYEEAIREMVHIQDEFEPDKQIHGIYKEIYTRIFEKIFDKLLPLYQEINMILASSTEKR
ncbi:MAG: FGGY-family carbohydrate kinase [Spirochaetaceae bacterium]|jgi:sugar (pentulose or hexulose) kinase|nr:FGGY-family carbohydrate kinase [Spirochaetaceae bacterium]